MEFDLDGEVYWRTDLDAYPILQNTYHPNFTRPLNTRFEELFDAEPFRKTSLEIDFIRVYQIYWLIIDFLFERLIRSIRKKDCSLVSSEEYKKSFKSQIVESIDQSINHSIN